MKYRNIPSFCALLSGDGLDVGLDDGLDGGLDDRLDVTVRVGVPWKIEVVGVNNTVVWSNSTVVVKKNQF